jgi:hypothetical protein
MLLWALTSVVAAALAMALWYVALRSANRKRSRRALRLIEGALAGHGSVVGVHWSSASRFHAQLRFSAAPFQHASVDVQLTPRELPLRWLMAAARKQPEMVTFEADLGLAPDFDLDVQNHRWIGRTRRLNPRRAVQWQVEHTQPFLITTREEWQSEFSPMMDALLAARQRDFHAVRYRRGSPHFSATIPLDAIPQSTDPRSGLFEALRELAGGASARRS